MAPCTFTADFTSVKSVDPVGPAVPIELGPPGKPLLTGLALEARLLVELKMGAVVVLPHSLPAHVTHQAGSLVLTFYMPIKCELPCKGCNKQTKTIIIFKAERQGVTR